MNLEGIEALMKLVPQTYGEAIEFYSWLKCEPHEWDNRTTFENATYLISNMPKREINYFKDIKEKKLAQILAGHPEQYDLQKSALEKGSRLGFLNSGINLESSLKRLNQSNLIASNGRLFLFEYESGFLNRVEEANETFYQIYKLVGNKMVWLEENWSDLGFGDISEIFNSKKITQVFTGDLPEGGYLGLEGESFDEEGDGYWLRQVDEEIIDCFREKGVEIINLGVLEE